MDDDMNTNMNRVRQYPVGHKGPYIVNIRALGVSLESKKIHKYVFMKYKHVKQIMHVNEHKMRVVFEDEKVESVVPLASEENKSPDIEMVEENKQALEKSKKKKVALKASILKAQTPVSVNSAREEANELPNCAEWNKKYRVYISAKNVEVQGVISWPKSETITDFVEMGEGKFHNGMLKSVKVVDAVRLKKKIVDEASVATLENTGAVIVTFEGILLPNKLNVDGLLIPVREFKAKQMFCDNCNRYNHTAKMCNNKKIEMPENISCLQCKSNEHKGGDAKCPKRKELEKKMVKLERQVRKKTIAEVLNELDPENVMPNESSFDNNFPLYPGMSRKRQADAKRAEKEKYSDVLKSPVRKKMKNDDQVPPGFVNPSREGNDFSVSVVEFIRTFVGEMELPAVINNLIEKFVYPLIHKIVGKITNSVMEKFNGLQWLATAMS